MDDEIPPLIPDEGDRNISQQCTQREEAPDILPSVNPYDVPPPLLSSTSPQRLIHEATPRQDPVLSGVVKDEDITSHTSSPVEITTSGAPDPTEVTPATPIQVKVKEESPQGTQERVGQQGETGWVNVNSGEPAGQVRAPVTQREGSVGQVASKPSPRGVEVEARSDMRVKIQEHTRSDGDAVECDDDEEEDVVIWILTDSDDEKPAAGATVHVNTTAAPTCEAAREDRRCRLRPRPPRDYRTIAAGMGKTVDIEMLYASAAQTLAPSPPLIVPSTHPPALSSVELPACKPTPHTPRTPRTSSSCVGVRRIICSSDSSPTSSPTSSSSSSLFSSPGSSPSIKALSSPSSWSSSTSSSSSRSSSSSGSSSNSSPSSSPTSTPLPTPSTTPVRPRRARLSRPTTLCLTPLALASLTTSAPDTPASPSTLSPAPVPFKRRADHWSNFVTPDNPEGYKPEQLARMARMTPEEQQVEKMRIRRARQYKEQCMIDDAKRQREILKRRRYNDQNREKQREYARDYNGKHREQQMHHMREHRKRLEVKQMKKEYNRAYNARRRAAAASAVTASAAASPFAAGAEASNASAEAADVKSE